MNQDGVQLVVFDLGRVLIRICDGWAHACDVAGVAPPARELSPAQQAALHEAVCRSEVGEIDLATFARTCAPHLGIPESAIVSLSNAYLLGPYPGTSQLLDDLRSAGVRTACLSNTNANHWRIVTDPASPNFLPLEKLTYQFASHLVRMRKPEARIYAHVEEQTGVPPGGILFFDDLAENLAAAAARGWRTHHVRTDACPIEQARSRLRDEGVLG
jgi:putative hydrolase of the HAD superfamily